MNRQQQGKIQVGKLNSAVGLGIKEILLSVDHVSQGFGN